MRLLVRFCRRAVVRSQRHFTLLREQVLQDNLRTLCLSAVSFELFLLGYGLLFAPHFHSPMLNGFYLLFLALNSGLGLFAFWYRRRKERAFRAVQGGCMVFIAQVLGFIICISVFPFPDRPAIFYSLAYMIVLPLFQFRFWQISLLLTGMTGLFCVLVVRFKTIQALAYDLAGAVTTWLLGFILLYVVFDLHLRNGETRIELERQTRTDPLTGLPNRREMDEFFHLTYRRCVELALPLGVVMLDVDYFKQFNDRFGHPAGDGCLMELGKRLADFARACGFFSARYGGEEFVVILPGCGRKETECYARELVEKLHVRGPDGKQVTVSLGAAVEIPAPGGTPAALLDRADKALYQAKEAGRDCFVLDPGVPAARETEEKWNVQSGLCGDHRPL